MVPSASSETPVRPARRPGSRPIAARLVAALLAIALGVALAGCDVGDDSDDLTGLDESSDSADFARGTGAPTLATKNTIRIPGDDPIADAAAAAIAVHPASNAQTRPKAVAVVGARDWRAAIAMSLLAARPFSAPLLLSNDDDLPQVTESAFEALNPSGATVPGLAQKPRAIVAGNLKAPEGTHRVNLVNTSYERLSLGVDAFWTRIRNGKPTRTVIVTTGDPAFARFALPAGPLAAKMGAPVFFSNRDIVPLATLRAIAAHKRPRIFVIGPPQVITDTVVRRLKRYGKVTRIGGASPIENAVAAAVYRDQETEWGWGIIQPGHGFVVMSARREMDVAAATTLSSGAAYGPLLLNSNAKTLDKPLENFFLDVQPGYIDDPSSGVYNRAWLIGDESVLSSSVQARVDALSTILPIDLEQAQEETFGLDERP